MGTKNFTILFIHLKFNLEIEETDELCKQLDNIFKTKKNNIICIDVFYEILEQNKKVLAERWLIQVDTSTQPEIKITTSYIQSCVLVRSLFTYVRIMPAYQLYKSTQKNQRGGVKMHYIITNREPIDAAFEEGKNFV